MPRTFEYRDEKMAEYNQKNEELLNDLPEFCKDYAVGIGGKRNPLTINIYLQRLNVFFRYADLQQLFSQPSAKIEFSNLKSIKLIDIERFADWIRKGGASGKTKATESTVNNYLSALESLWDYGCRHRILEINVIKLVERGKKEKHDVIAMEIDQTKEFLENVRTGENLSKREQLYHDRHISGSTRDIAICTLLLRTGLRVSEMVGIDLDDLNLERKYVHVKRKESKETIVNLSDETCEVLSEYLTQRNSMTPPPSSSALFVVTQNGPHKGERLSVRSVQNLVKKYALGGVPELGADITPHKLRSSYATQILGKTHDLNLTQQLLSHESPATTSLYISKRTADMSAIRNALDEDKEDKR